eukprot:jgi/Ulvmu1/9612/UM054_0042.1
MWIDCLAQTFKEAVRGLLQAWFAWMSIAILEADRRERHRFAWRMPLGCCGEGRRQLVDLDVDCCGRDTCLWIWMIAATLNMVWSVHRRLPGWGSWIAGVLQAVPGWGLWIVMA